MADEDSQPKSETVLGALTRFLTGRRRALTEEELQEAISSSEEEGLLDESEGDMLQAIFEFGDTIVREIMVARPDMVCCASDAPLDELLNLILDSGHSRVPIFEGSVDHIVGVIYAKDLLRYWGARPGELSPAAVMRTPYFVPETKRIEDLLVDFRTRRVHMAIVVDEYGGTSGLITIEDLLEEIVGDIQDEYDLEEEWAQPQSDGSLLLDARANVEELEEHFDVEIPRDKFDTVGGFVVHLLGTVPAAGETARANGLLLQVVEADERKVRRVHARRDPEAAAPENNF
ncbi:MAG: hemolysin family protein [Desulfuromonadales bacterium]|nr:hemolysin family protein [Desulfuromonadales bacterium]